MTLQLHYFPTLNAHKVTIALEEMGLAYDVVMIDILNDEQFRPEFTAINPNNRIPALVDGEVTVFESAAILQYLGRKTGQFYPSDEPTRAAMRACQAASWGKSSSPPPLSGYLSTQVQQHMSAIE